MHAICQNALMDFWRDHQRVRLLGKGSYGSAVLFVNKATAAHYVVKEVDLKVMDRANARIAEQEAKILLALRHPNIVACHSSWVQGGKLFIVMEYCAHGVLLDPFALKTHHSILEYHPGQRRYISAASFR